MINICVAIEINYIDQCAILINSIIKNEYQENLSKLFFYIIIKGEYQSDYEIFKKTFKGINFLIIPVGSADKIEVFTNQKYNFNTANEHLKTNIVFYRLFIPYFLTNVSGKILYLDCDMIVTEPISELFNSVSLKDYPIAAIPNEIYRRNIRDIDLMDKYFPLVEETINRKVRYDVNVNSFNAGVFMFDIDLWKIKYIDMFMEMIRLNNRYDILVDNDQGILNTVFYDNFEKIENKWNQLDFGCSKSWLDTVPDVVKRNKKILKNPSGIIHWNGPENPWLYKSEDNHPFPSSVLLWNKYRI